MAKSPVGFLAELKRRKVYRVAVVYVLVAFGVWQVADIAFPGLGLPDQAITLVLVLTVLGFPIALVLAWAYEVRPEAPTVDRAADAETRERTGPDVGRASTDAEPRPEAEASIAVLPFENLSAGEDSEFFADGITEEITHTLAQFPGMRVVARTSAFAFKGHAADIREVARQLRVSHVLEGSVRRAGERLRITVQLIDAAEGFHLWSDRFDREMGDVFAVQDEIAERVAGQLSSGLSSDVTVGIPAIGSDRGDTTESVDAYDAYLRGKQERARFDPLALESAARHFSAAIEHDPDFAPAHAALAEACSIQAIGIGLASHDTMPRAREAADRALELSPALSDGHVARALVALFYERDYARAKRGLDRAIALNPNSADAYLWSEFYWTYIARTYESALAATTRARELNPLDPGTRIRLGTVYYLFEHLDRAETFFLEFLEEQPEAPIARMALADVLVRKERFEEAARHADLVLDAIGLEAAPGAPMGLAGAARALSGNREGAREVLAALERRAGVGFVTSFWQAVVRAALGERDEAFRILDRALEERDSSLLYAYAAPEQIGLRDDPRFPGLLDRLNLSHLIS